jgi:hypothetical protein
MDSGVVFLPKRLKGCGEHYLGNGELNWSHDETRLEGWVSVPRAASSLAW